LVELKLLPINQVEFNKEIYPRLNYGWQTAYDYAMSMKAGANFPPIVVAEYEGTYFLVDGKHRLEASKLNKQDSIQCEILRGLTWEKIFLEAVERNIKNSRPFSPQEKAHIAHKLRGMKFTDIQVSVIVQIPMEKLSKFVADRVTNTISGEEVVLKSPLRNFAGEIISDEMELGQRILSATSQEQLLNQMVFMLENNSFKRIPKITNKLKHIRKLIANFVLKRK